MNKIYLFDWGNTLMVDFPDQQGKMYLWPNVKAVKNAECTLKALSLQYPIYVATSAQDSSEQDIQQAFQRVGLDPYINGYFCKANLGLDKNRAEFYLEIAKTLCHPPHQLIMVGDALEKDIYPANEAGLQTIWYNPNKRPVAENIDSIQDLKELLNEALDRT
ncbi:HAD family hydrolase [Vibrio neptunius]|uniref:HAD family hydrolase n=1 Tax=Vibrio neptunius TaxID=170651 RepID=UPI0005FA875F|nr:HAD hydrolase-like protein [Vibrio neptunius]KJY88330.1 HAD family hydrolase [Vibrio neptunius]